MPTLNKQNIIVAITGSIAAYKTCELVRELRKATANVRVCLSAAAQEFVTPLTLQALSENPVHTDMFAAQSAAAMDHISLARWADILLIAPASADTIADLAIGKSATLISTLALVTRAPIIIAPAMNTAMLNHPATQANIAILSQRGVHVWFGEDGTLACGELGAGRMCEPMAIIKRLQQFAAPPVLAGVRILITAGPTHEALDPVRYISNTSTGLMGYSLAQAAIDAGAAVTLISGPVHISKPTSLTQWYDVTSAAAMNAAVQRAQPQQDIMIFCAAVANYKPAKELQQKIKKDADTITLQLVKTADIALSASLRNSKQQLFIGFAAETEQVEQHAKEKLAHKKLDIIFANMVGKNCGFGDVEHTVTAYTRATIHHAQPQQTFGPKKKAALGRDIIAWIATFWLQYISSQSQ